MLQTGACRGLVFGGGITPVRTALGVTPDLTAPGVTLDLTAPGVTPDLTAQPKIRTAPGKKRTLPVPGF